MIQNRNTKSKVNRGERGSKTERNLRPRKDPQYDNSIDGMEFTDPRRAAARMLYRAKHIANIVSEFDRHDFPPKGFPPQTWFDQVLHCLISARFDSHHSITDFRATRLKAISRVAQFVLPECPVVIRGEGEQIWIWQEPAPRLDGDEYKLVELMVNEFPLGITETAMKKAKLYDGPKKLRTIARKFPEWRRVLKFPGKKAKGGYRFLSAPSEPNPHPAP